MQKIPYMLVVGEKEAAAGTVAVRETEPKATWGPRQSDDFLFDLKREMSYNIVNGG